MGKGKAARPTRPRTRFSCTRRTGQGRLAADAGMTAEPDPSGSRRSAPPLGLALCGAMAPRSRGSVQRRSPVTSESSFHVASRPSVGPVSFFLSSFLTGPQTASAVPSRGSSGLPQEKPSALLGTEGLPTRGGGGFSAKPLAHLWASDMTKQRADGNPSFPPFPHLRPRLRKGGARTLFCA